VDLVQPAQGLAGIGVDLRAAKFFFDPRELAANGEIDVFVELIGGADGVAYEAVKAALERGVPVVTAAGAIVNPPPATGDDVPMPTLVPLKTNVEPEMMAVAPLLT